MTYFLIVLALIIAYNLFRFFSDVNKDTHDLEGTTLSEKFSVVVNAINQHAYDGQGKVNYIDKRNFSLYQDKKNQIILFEYGTGILTITWKYKYYQKEVVHKKSYPDVRNLSIFEQQKITDSMISSMDKVIEKHKQEVLRITEENVNPSENYKYKKREDKGFLDKVSNVEDDFRHSPDPQAKELLETFEQDETMKIAMQSLAICVKATDILAEEFKAISKEGHYEATIFNALKALEVIQIKYRKDEIEKIYKHIIMLLIIEGENNNIQMTKEGLNRFIQARFRYFNDILEKMADGNIFNTGVYQVFYESPLAQHPKAGVTSNLEQAMTFIPVLTAMMGEVSDNIEAL